MGLAIGALVGWLVGRPAQARLRTELDQNRVVHAERLKAYAEAEGHLREAFQALSAEALKTNNQTFLDLAETRLRDARSQAAADIDARKLAVENLLVPMARTLEQVDREIRESVECRARPSRSAPGRAARHASRGRSGPPARRSARSRP